MVVNIGTSESLLLWKEELIFEDEDFVCLAHMRLALLVSAICRDCFDVGVVEKLPAGGLTIICVSMRH